MAQKKLVRFAAIKTYPHVLEYPDNMPGKWRDFFGNDHPITLELACGRGEYAVGLARLHPMQNFIGVDIKGNRIYVGARQVLNEGLRNAGFLRTHIDKIATYFAKGEVQHIWITFPDPQLRTSRARKRLTHPRFLRLYQQILSCDGFVHLKTDSPALFEFTKRVIEMYGLKLVEENDDIYKDPALSDELKIKTHYELLDIAGSNRTHYLRFALPPEPLPDLDEHLQEFIKLNENAAS
ncbi:MAG: tRNA (guanosine(46)-N7)-methyltransferase TrmB [Chitinophagaceae bacterium]|nr:tRNA (guanosine(46)-N7)-methyltransferase TrmB [Chitinophagaceae bacterium]